MSSMIRKHCHHKRAYGVGLVDVLIAVTIISGGLVAMGRLQGASATSSAVASQQSEAGFIAQKVIEDLRAKSWASIVPGSHTLQPQVGRSATYNINYTVTESMSGGPLFKTVIAIVSWNDSSNQLQRSTITTRFQQNGAEGTVRMLGMNASDCSSSSVSESRSQSSESKKCSN